MRTLSLVLELRGNLPLLVACLLVSLAVRLTVGLGVVSGTSMRPTLSPGDLVLYVRHLGPSPGAVVVADLPGHGLVVKRVAAVGTGGRRDPGENGGPGRDDPGPSAASGDAYCYLLGDNRDDSYDSRAFGPLPATRVVGRVVLVWRSDPADSPRLRWVPGPAMSP